MDVESVQHHARDRPKGWEITVAKIDLWNPKAIGKSKKAEIASEIRSQHSWLESEIENLYVEFDKLTKKSPGQPITVLALENVNCAISDAKELLEGDRAVDRISKFVPAGENPANSDVLLVLSKLRAALTRFKKVWAGQWSSSSPSSLDRFMGT